jgi:thiol:disulfide interchange protein DsbC
MSHSFGKPFSKNSLNLPKVALLGLAIAITGCNSNSTEAKQSKPVTSKNTTTASAESDPAVVNAIQANLKASGIEQKIISAVPTSMENMYWVNAEGVPAFYSDKEGRHIILGQILEVLLSIAGINPL